jgi:hypothetical protein
MGQKLFSDGPPAFSTHCDAEMMDDGECRFEQDFEVFDGGGN